MAIENRTDNKPEEADELKLTGKISSVSSSKVDFNTKIIYKVNITTYDPKALILGGLDASSIVDVRIKPHDKKAANQKREFK